jgi:histone H3/H4
MALAVKSAVKAQLKGLRVSGDFFKGLDNCIAAMLKAAAARAKANGRKTIRACDL